MTRIYIWIAFMVAMSSAVIAGDTLTAFTGALIYTVAGDPIEDGVLVIRDAEIVDIGPRDRVSVPSGARIVDATGKVIIPGMVDTHSHIGRGDGGDRSAPIHPDVRILDTIDAMNDSFMRARAGGITTVNIMPGSGHLMSGQTVYLKTRHARTIYDMLMCDNVTNGICGGLKMANGTNSIGDPPFPQTRSKSAAIVRQLYIRAQDYRDKIRAANGDPEKMPSRDLQLETLVEVLEGKRIVHHHTHRHDDIMTVIRLANEFGFRVVLHHVSEGWKVADEIAAANIPASIILVDSPGGKLEAVNLIYENGRDLEMAGVDVAFHTDDPITDSRLFLRQAAIGVRTGMSIEKALEGLTLAGARMLGLEERIGSLERGKDADLVILSGDPFSVYTHVEQTWIDGKLVFDRSNPDHYEYAVGGYNVYRTMQYHHHHDLGGGR
jgi:imidazolonepropionase-like amidohydrolase